MAIGPFDGGVQFEGSPDVADKKPGATHIQAQADRKDLRPDHRSSNSMVDAVND